MKQNRAKILGTAAVLLIVLLAAIVYEVNRTRTRAEHLLRVVRSIQVGQMNLEQTAELLRSHGAIRQAGPCDQRKCAYALYLSNFLLERLHLAPRTELAVIVSGASGRVDEVYLAYKSGKGAELVAVSVTNRSCYPCYKGQETFGISRTRDTESGRPLTAVAEITPVSTPAQKEQAYNFNLHCLARLGGCADAHQLAPSLWQ